MRIRDENIIRENDYVHLDGPQDIFLNIKTELKKTNIRSSKLQPSDLISLYINNVTPLESV